MTRIRTIAALIAVAALALPGAALAANVTGGTTQLALSSGAATALQNHHLTVTVDAPATASGSTFTFPISRGRLSTPKLRGRIGQRGVLKISNGTRTVAARHLELVSNQRGVSLWGVVGQAASVKQTSRHTGAKARRLARLSNISVKNGSATGTVRLTAYAAKAINVLAHHHMARGSMPIGTITITPTFG
jgi:hypothetical protein